jgi:hypothetical protein
MCWKIYLFVCTFIFEYVYVYAYVLSCYNRAVEADANNGMVICLYIYIYVLMGLFICMYVYVYK